MRLLFYKCFYIDKWYYIKQTSLSPIISNFHSIILALNWNNKKRKKIQKNKISLVSTSKNYEHLMWVKFPRSSMEKRYQLRLSEVLPERAIIRLREGLTPLTRVTATSGETFRLASKTFKITCTLWMFVCHRKYAHIE